MPVKVSFIYCYIIRTTCNREKTASPNVEIYQSELELDCSLVNSLLIQRLYFCYNSVSTCKLRCDVSVEVKGNNDHFSYQSIRLNTF